MAKYLKIKCQVSKDTLPSILRYKKDLSSILAREAFSSLKDGVVCQSYLEIAPLGQASAQVPHSVHSSGLIE